MLRSCVGSDGRRGYLLACRRRRQGKRGESAAGERWDDGSVAHFGAENQSVAGGRRQRTRPDWLDWKGRRSQRKERRAGLCHPLWVVGAGSRMLFRNTPVDWLAVYLFVRVYLVGWF